MKKALLSLLLLFSLFCAPAFAEDPTPIYSTAYRNNYVITRKTTWPRNMTKPDSAAALKDEVIGNIRWDNDSDVELFLEGDRVIVYSPMTRETVQVECNDTASAQSVFNFISLRITYYHAEDRSWYNKTARVRGLDNNYTTVPADDSRDRMAWSEFIAYLFRADSIPYKQSYDKYFVTGNTVVIGSDMFIGYVLKFQPSFAIEHKYLPISDTAGMERKVQDTYSPDTCKRWLD